MNVKILELSIKQKLKSAQNVALLNTSPSNQLIKAKRMRTNKTTIFLRY